MSPSGPGCGAAQRGDERGRTCRRIVCACGAPRSRYGHRPKPCPHPLRYGRARRAMR